MTRQELSDDIGERIMKLPPGPVYPDPIALMDVGVHFQDPRTYQAISEPTDPYAWHDIATLIDYGNV